MDENFLSSTFSNPFRQSNSLLIIIKNIKSITKALNFISVSSIKTNKNQVLNFLSI
jgi:hypothetical protein